MRILNLIIFMIDKNTGYYLRDPKTGKPIRENVALNPENDYKIFFLAKTRNDKRGASLVYQFNG